MQPRRRAAWLAGACAILTLVLPTLSLADYIANIQFAHNGPTHFPHGERAYVSFDYDITVPGGARLKVAPYHDGAPMPSYSWSGSAVYGPGTGTHTTWFSYLTGERYVDQYYVAMVSDDWSTTYLELLLPVNYFFGEHGIFNIETSHDSPSWLRRDTYLYIDFDYASTEAGGVRIGVLPYHQGTFCTGCWGPAQELLPPSGSHGTCFTFPSQDADVDQLRFTMRAADGDTLTSFFVPVDLHWREYEISNIALDPLSPEGLVHHEHLTAAFDYSSPEPFRVWAHPFTDGWYTPNYAVQDGGVVPAGSGTLSRYCTIISGDAWIDEVRLVVKDAASVELLLEVFVPVRYHYGEHAVRNVQYAPPGPAILSHDEFVAT
ncbi:MAG: hypothetical protein JW819_00375, partial [Candidatus Krumholzibacteriota bacterium]|nr:hypothetical protein [Candidatus Krumholzibacteriota bacterium]